MIRLTLLTALGLLASFPGSFAQTAPLNGQVRDLTEGTELPGVNILVKGTSVGTITDVEGNYSLSVPADAETLVFSSVGYETLEVPINNRTTIDIDLSPDIQSLQEIVVVGYGTQKREDVTGSIVSAPLEAFEEAPNTNILQSLAGSTPGINIGQVATAGEEPNIQIRGQSSINGNQDPLIVLERGVLSRKASRPEPQGHCLGRRA